MKLPAGFERLLADHAIAVARTAVAAPIRRALIGSDGTKVTLHEFASRQPGARPLAGRGIAYAFRLPDRPERYVVRHNRHGGLFAPITGDRFLAPTRGPYELAISLELGKLGVPTPEIVAFVVYPPGGILQRCDVCSREVPQSKDLAEILRSGTEQERAAGLAAAATLVGTMSRARARHHDLNAKNILVAGTTAYALDVDRVVLDVEPEAAFVGNVARLARSLRKWRDQFGVRVTDGDISELEARARSA